MKSAEISSCPVARTAHLIGDAWVVLVLRDLFRGVHRFDDLQKSTGAATNILTNRLKRLMESGLVTKEMYQERPQRFVYKLTRAGFALFPVLMELMRYGEEWLPSETPTTNRLFHKDCGKITRAGQICSECGGSITLKNVELVEVCAAAGSQIPAVDRAFAVERQINDA